MDYRILTTHWAQHGPELIALRTQVFMQEQQVSAADEWDGQDETATHFLVCSGAQAIGCARLLDEVTSQKKRCFHIGRVALLKPYRHAGIGSALMRHMLQHCQQLAPAQPIYLHAQTHLQLFYERLGFYAEGDEFMDAGIAHICMWFRGATHG